MPQNKKKSKKILDKAKSIGNINVTNPFAFVKLPYHIQQSRPMDYRWVEYDYASHMAQKWGIKSARQYRSFITVFKPSGFPKNPDQVYRRYWESWDTFLDTPTTYEGYKENAVTALELLPYNEARQWTVAKQFPTVDAFQEAFDNGQILKGIPRAPQVRYKEFYPNRGWKGFLGKKIEDRLDAAKNVEPVCALCQNCNQQPNILTLVISSQGAAALDKQIQANPDLTAVKAYYWHHEFGEYIFELMDKMGTKQNENSWMFPDLNNLYYELGSVLEVYRPR